MAFIIVNPFMSLNDFMGDRIFFSHYNFKLEQEKKYSCQMTTLNIYVDGDGEGHHHII